MSQDPNFLQELELEQAFPHRCIVYAGREW
jgi:hypothetical protein